MNVGYLVGYLTRNKMNEYSQQIKRELEGFQSAIQKLGTGIKAASSLWKDPKITGIINEI